MRFPHALLGGVLVTVKPMHDASPVQQPREAAHRAVRLRGLELLDVPVADARLPLVVHRPICIGMMTWSQRRTDVGF